MAHLEKDMKYQLRSGVIGHAVGDALGVPVEFKSREELMRDPVCDMRSYGTHGMPAGTWSDDTSMEIALMQSLIDRKTIDYEDIMNNFVKWYRDDEFTATGITFDVGGTCAGAIGNYYRRGTDPLQCGGAGVSNNGNGSLMRILPLAYICHAQNIVGQARYELTRNISSLTHAHEISVLGCYIYVNYVCHLLDGEDAKTAYEHTKQDDYSMFTNDAKTAYERVLAANIAAFDAADISGSGYVVSSLEAALWCLLNSTSYKDATLKAVNLGKDTDTVGAITGSLAGICYGYDNIPQEWVNQLQRRDYLLSLCDELVATEVEI